MCEFFRSIKCLISHLVFSAQMPSVYVKLCQLCIETIWQEELKTLGDSDAIARDGEPTVAHYFFSSPSLLDRERGYIGFIISYGLILSFIGLAFRHFAIVAHSYIYQRFC